MQSVILSPSLLSADFSRVGEQLRLLEQAGATHLHLDVMDGKFVPNISFGIPVIRSLRKSTALFFDTHLMIDKPERFIPQFAEAGSDAITIHVEATRRPDRVLEQIRSFGKQAALSLKPGTALCAIEPYLPLCDRILVMTVEPGFGGQAFMPDMLDKIRALAELKRQNAFSYEIQVDGGIGMKTAAPCVRAGAENLVAGSSIFGAADPGEAYRSLYQTAQEAQDAANQ